MKLKNFLILIFPFLIYNLIIYLINKGVLFTNDTHLRYFYLHYVPYYLVLFFMSLFYKYKIITLLCVVPTSLLVWSIREMLIDYGLVRIPNDILLIISSILLLAINELVQFLKNTRSEKSE